MFIPNLFWFRMEFRRTRGHCYSRRLVLFVVLLPVLSSFLLHVPTSRRRTGLFSEETIRKRDISFVSPLIDEGYPLVEDNSQTAQQHLKPLLLYLPGFDGTWLAPFIQFPELGTMFDIQCLTMTMQDRSTYSELKQDVIGFIHNNCHEVAPTPILMETNETLATATINAAVSKQERTNKFFTNFWSFSDKQSSSNDKDKKRPVYLVGESFGGILASDVALSLLQQDQDNNTFALKGLVLINAATCYDRSKLASMGPKVAQLPTLLYPLGVFLFLVPLLMDKYSWPQLLLILTNKALPSVIDTEEREAYMGRVAFSLPFKLQFMPQGTLKWRLTEWLDMGCSIMSFTFLKKFQDYKAFRTLIVAGETDVCLPSIDEAERLATVFPNAHIHIVESAGHATTCGSRLDLTALLRFHFPDLARGGGRTTMKAHAAEGKGVMLGLEPRYNGKEEGLSPLLYWSTKLYQKPRKTK